MSTPAVLAAVGQVLREERENTRELVSRTDSDMQSVRDILAQRIAVLEGLAEGFGTFTREFSETTLDAFNTRTEAVLRGTGQQVECALVDLRARVEQTHTLVESAGADLDALRVEEKQSIGGLAERIQEIDEATTDRLLAVDTNSEEFKRQAWITLEALQEQTEALAFSFRDMVASQDETDSQAGQVDESITDLDARILRLRELVGEQGDKLRAALETFDDRWDGVEIRFIEKITAVREQLAAGLQERDDQGEALASEHREFHELVNLELDALQECNATTVSKLTEQRSRLVELNTDLSAAIAVARETYPDLDRWINDGHTRAKGCILSYRGGAWQARVSTQEEPGHGSDWDLLVEGIHEIRQVCVDHGELQFLIQFSGGREWHGKISLPLFDFCGRWEKDRQYKFYDITSDDGNQWAAIQDAPEGRPSTSLHWKLIGMRGGRGRKGERGERGTDGSVPPIEEVVKQWREYLEADEAIALNRYRGVWKYNAWYDRGDVISVGRGLYLSTSAGKSEIPPGPMDDGRWLMLVEPLAFGGGGGGGSATDELVGVSENDTTPGYLSGKLQSADASVIFSVINAGGDEVLDLQATGEGGGEANLGSNVGGGVELYKAKNGVALEIRTVGATASVVPALNGDLLELTVQDGIIVPAPHVHDDFAGPGTVGFVPDPVTDTGQFLSEGGTWETPPVSPIGGVELSYDWSSNTSATNPGSGFIKGNNADHTLITEIYVNSATRFGNDAGFVWAAMHEDEILGIWDESGQASSWYGMLTGAPVDNGGWYTIPVSVIPGTIGGMDNNSKVAVFPIHNPAEKVPVGGNAGEELLKTSDANFDTQWGYGHGSQTAESMAAEQPVLSIVDDGGLQLEVEAVGGGDIRFLIAGAMITLDCTTGPGTGGKARVALNEGASASEAVQNGVYVINSGGVGALLTTTTYPVASAWAWIGVAVVPDATTFATTGPYVLQRFTEAFEHNGRGAQSYVREKARVVGATYWDGGDHTLTIVPNPAAADSVHVEVASAVVYQLHRQSFPAFDAGPYMAFNGTILYQIYADLNEVLTDSNGVSLEDSRFNLVIGGVVNQDTGVCKLFVNRPNGSYNSDAQCQADSSNTADYSAPREFKTVAFLICRVAMRHRSQNNGTWTELGIYSLLGAPLGARVGGAGAAAANDFADSQFSVYDNDDATKRLAFEASVISADTTRVITMPDADVTLAIDGEKVPAGGTTGQALVKASDSDLDTEWEDQSGGVTVHNDLTGRDAADCHPIAAVTDLQGELDLAPKLIQATALAGIDIDLAANPIEAAIDAAYDYEIHFSPQVGINGELFWLQVGTASGWQTTGKYAYLFTKESANNGFSSGTNATGDGHFMGGGLASKQVTHKILISTGGALRVDNANILSTGRGYDSNGLSLITTSSGMNGTDATAMTRFRIYSNNPHTLNGGRILVYRMPYTV